MASRKERKRTRAGVPQPVHETESLADAARLPTPGLAEPAAFTRASVAHLQRTAGNRATAESIASMPLQSSWGNGALAVQRDSVKSSSSKLWKDELGDKGAGKFALSPTGKDALKSAPSSAEVVPKRFTPRLSTANQVSEVKVRAWDPGHKKEIVGSPKASSSLGSKDKFDSLYKTAAKAPLGDKSTLDEFYKKP